MRTGQLRFPDLTEPSLTDGLRRVARHLGRDRADGLGTHGLVGWEPAGGFRSLAGAAFYCSGQANDIHQIATSSWTWVWRRRQPWPGRSLDHPTMVPSTPSVRGPNFPNGVSGGVRPSFHFVKGVGAYGRLPTGHVPIRNTADKMTPLRSRVRNRTATKL